MTLSDGKMLKKSTEELFKQFLPLLFSFSIFLLKDTLKKKLFKKTCEDFDSYLIQVLGSPALQPGFGISGGKVDESTPEPQKEISESVSHSLV